MSEYSKFESLEHEYNFAIIDYERRADLSTFILRFNSKNGMDSFVQDRPFLDSIDVCKVLDELTKIVKVNVY